MIARYGEDAGSAAEAKKLGQLTPLCDAIPELAVWGDSPPPTSAAPPGGAPKKTTAPHLVLIEGGATERSSG